MFDEVVINLTGNDTFKIITKNNSKKNKYIQSATLNGELLSTPFFEHTDIVKGGVLEFVMGDKPQEWNY